MGRLRRNPVPLLGALVVVALVLGIWLGGHPGTLPGFARDTLVADSEGRLYQEAVDVIERDYYRPVDRGALVDHSIDAAVRSLDDQFSNYFSPRAYHGFEVSTQGQFEGVGMQVRSVKQGLRVLSVYRGSPAQEGGLRAGDVITRVNGRSLAGKSSDAATTLIRGRAGTAVRLTVGTGADARVLRLERETVDIPVVESAMERAGGKRIAWVHLASFTAGAHGEVGTAVRRLLARGADGVVLDLRDNTGGLLSEAVTVASVFLPDGRVVSTRGRSRPEKVYDATGGAIDAKIPVAVLVNRNSASASEIVTGALQDRHRATVVGTRTFGKGVFQEIERLSNGGALDITVGEYFTPSGRNLGGGGVKRGAGITPDVQAQDDTKTRQVDEGLRAAVRTVAAK
jgi:carboxyl-terminal processing protease